MKRLLSRWFDFDYDIIGDYLDFDGKGRYQKKYIKRHKIRRKAGGKWHYLPTL